MKARTVEIWVGVFVSLGIAAMLMLALQVSGLSDFYQNERGYVIKAAFTHIGGLKPRSKVTISGVTVGRVTRIDLERSKYGEYEAIVTLTLDPNMSRIPNDSSAKIFTSGLLGDNYIGIIPGQSEEYLTAGDTIELTSQAVLLEDLISKFATSGS